MAMEVTQVLLNAQSIDGTVRKHAEESLRQFQEQNLPGFLVSLSGELASEDKPVDSRKLAGLILKNALDAKDENRKRELSTATQVIAKVAGIELPQKQWPELIGSLLSNIHQVPSHVKQATLETLGYLCEEVSPQVVDQDQVNKIHTTVVQVGRTKSKIIRRICIPFQSMSKQANCVIVSVEYHLAPENPLPSAYDDGFNVLMWLKREGLNGCSSVQNWWKGTNEITTRWTVVMRFALLPWKPELVFTGTSVMGINPENGKFCSHVDCWDSIEKNDYFSLEGCTLGYAIAAILGYLMFGEEVESQVTLNLQTGKLSSRMAIYTTLGIFVLEDRVFMSVEMDESCEVT
ncbi:hypothetical protein SESBI_17443 [Sesbania bispinosa]|nr:hypothetical protein SESBI_17443 [Sesbania bispinosa]